MRRGEARIDEVLEGSIKAEMDVDMGDHDAEDPFTVHHHLKMDDLDEEKAISSQDDVEMDGFEVETATEAQRDIEMGEEH